MIVFDHTGQPYDADLVAGAAYRDLDRKLALCREALDKVERETQEPRTQRIAADALAVTDPQL